MLTYKYNYLERGVINMPNKNGTGPEGRGPRTGRGLGPCGDGTPQGGGRGRGFGTGPGFRRNVDNESKSKTEEN